MVPGYSTLQTDLGTNLTILSAGNGVAPTVASVWSVSIVWIVEIDEIAAIAEVEAVAGNDRNARNEWNAMTQEDGTGGIEGTEVATETIVTGKGGRAVAGPVRIEGRPKGWLTRHQIPVVPFY